jgi:hypothetical protein
MNAPTERSTGLRTSRGVWRHLSGRSRASALRVGVASCVALVTCLVTIGGVAATGSPAAAAAGPACKFTGPAIGALVINVTAGESINVDCKGFPANHPYLLIETSLLVAIDPAAAPLLQGQTTSLPGLLALISALPEMNALSVAFPTSNSSGVLNTNYTVPTSQPLDPNATCPPTTEELNSGLIGCAVAMIDLESFKPVTEGTFVLNYKGQPYFPPDPTLALGSAIAKKGQWLSVSDAPGAKTYWWLATLVSLYANLAGTGGSSGPIPVVVKVAGRKALTNAAVTPASYNGTTLTPPILSGQFFTKGHGHVWVKVSLNASLLGIPVSNLAQQKLKIIG